MRKTQRVTLLRITDRVTGYNDLAFGVGRSLAGALETGFLAFLDASIAGQQACLAQIGVNIRLHDLQGARQAHFNRIGLPGDAAAFDHRGHIQMGSFFTGGYESSQDNYSERRLIEAIPIGIASDCLRNVLQ